MVSAVWKKAKKYEEKHKSESCFLQPAPSFCCCARSKGAGKPLRKIPLYVAGDGSVSWGLSKVWEIRTVAVRRGVKSLAGRERESASLTSLRAKSQPLK